MLKMAIRQVLAERPYRTVGEIAVLLNYTEGTIRRNLRAMPDVAGIAFKKHRLFCLRGATPHCLPESVRDPSARILQAVGIAVDETGTPIVTIRRTADDPCRNLLAAVNRSGPCTLPTLVANCASAFRCSEPSAQVFLIAYAAWVRRQTGSCAFDAAIGSLPGTLNIDTPMIQKACTELRQAGLVIPNHDRPFSDEGILAGHIMEGVWMGQT